MLLINDDCLTYLKTLQLDSVDSLITDPPAGISFMNKSWDKSTDFIQKMTEIYKECLRVLKPGAHGLIWAIPRTSHWTATALEQAGFEIRDVVTHIFGSGFPKSLDVSKAIDKMLGVQGEISGKNPAYRERQLEHDAQWPTPMRPEFKRAPGSEEAKQWKGFGTALKPASEHWVLVRKPLSESTVAKNVLKHGTGGLNIDASRIEGAPGHPGSTPATPNGNTITHGKMIRSEYIPSEGRFPANLVLSHNEDCELVGVKEVKASRKDDKVNVTEHETKFGQVKCNEITKIYGNGDGKETVEAWQCTDSCAVKALDDQSGFLHPAGNKKNKAANEYNNSSYHMSYDNKANRTYKNDKGGSASRFFYCAKASKRDRGTDNKHPTVKSTKLMEYLIRLITPPQGTVLDPFMGSGSTGVAAKRLGFEFIGIEKETEYFEIAKTRIEGLK